MRTVGEKPYMAVLPVASGQSHDRSSAPEAAPDLGQIVSSLKFQAYLFREGRGEDVVIRAYGVVGAALVGEGHSIHDIEAAVREQPVRDHHG